MVSMRTMVVECDTAVLPQLFAAAHIEQGDHKERKNKYEHKKILHCLSGTP
jgi:hypothetical protein